MAELIAMIRRLEKAARSLNTAGEDGGLFPLAVELAAEVFGMDVCCLYLKGREDRLELAAQVGFPEVMEREVMDLSEGIMGAVVTGGEAFVTGDVRSVPNYKKRIVDTKSEMACPVYFEGEVVGAIDLQSRKASAFSREDVDLFQCFATHVGAAYGIELQRSRAERYALIRRVGTTFVEGSSLEESMQKVVDIVATTLDYSQTAVLLLDPDLEELELISAYGYGEVTGLRIPLSQGATGYAAMHGEPVNIPDVRADHRYVKGMNRGRSELAVPVTLGEEVIGVIDVESPRKCAFDEKDVETLAVVASYAAAAIRLWGRRELAPGEGARDGS